MIAVTPTQTKGETLSAQEACAKAWKESRLRNGVDRMKLIYKAFPHSVNGGETIGGLRITYLEEYNALGVSDEGGFLTLIGDEDFSAETVSALLQQLFLLLSLESKNPGAVRELITGVPRPKALETPQVPENKLSLGDLGL